MEKDLKIVFEVFGKTYVSTDSSQLDKDQVIKCLADILTQIHRADNVRTSGSEFKHQIRTIIKNGRASVNNMMAEHVLSIQE